ncbi:MAG: hypothetical protein D6796_04620 [Caldilineae bacterium]|nr:MAG: hypothetical protein D6796_04620 [Caldilineae bacterium]
MPDKKSQATPSVETAQEVERIRDIIFGPQMRDYEQRFQTLQRDLSRLQQELDRLTDQLAEQGNSHNKKLNELRRDMRQADDDLRDEMRRTAAQLTNDKVDRMALGALFIELGNQLQEGGLLADMLKKLASQTQ